MFFPQEFLEEIREKVDIVDLVSQYVDLKPAGKNYRALCPFHEEKTPSFIVSPEKGIFHCFGCGVGGNIFSFIMKIEGVSFPEAVTIIAEKYGVSLPERKSDFLSGEALERKRLLELHRVLQRFYQAQLANPQSQEAQKAKRYLLEERGLKLETIERFGIGFSPPEGRETLNYLMKQGFSGKEFLSSGAGVLSKGGQLLDRFRGRITFALHDDQGRIIGFAGRSLSGETPKYVNAPDSPVFSKSKTLYGLFAAKGSIRKAGKAVVVEGYMDFLALYEAGVGNCVASMGTAFTSQQASLLRRYTQQVTLCFDSDSAGEAATLRGVELLRAQGLEVKIVRIPPPFDPDSLLRQRGKEALFKILSQEMSYFDFYLELLLKQHGYKTVESKVKIIQTLVPYLRVVDVIERELRIKQLARTLGVEESLVYRAVGKATDTQGKTAERNPVLTTDLREPGNIKAEKMIIKKLLEDLSSREKLLKEFEEDDFSYSNNRRLWRAINTLILKKKDFSFADLAAVFINDSDMQRLISEIATREDLEFGLEREEVVQDLVRTVKKNALSRRRKSTERELSRISAQLSRSALPEEEQRRLKALLQEKLKEYDQILKKEKELIES
ncbi:DNA primase [Thermatribacter velox]|uniref:DNA primase n=1 Tax=Thermatribacter velox TaxID=3039681 RepID=A0ABZ2Y7V1_9BACT